MNNIWKIILFVWMSAVMVLAVLYPIPFIPALGDKARILFFHVPMAWTSVVAFFMAMFYSVKYLTKKDILFDFKAASAAGLGLLFCILATVTGAVWAKFNWGAFWNWDPRQTSIFLLLLIYGAYFALRSAVPSEDSRAKLASVYSILAFVTVPFFIFIVPRIVSSLHPEPIINVQGKIKMDTGMLLIFIASLISFMVLFFWMLSLRIRLSKITLSRIEFNAD